MKCVKNIVTSKNKYLKIERKRTFLQILINICFFIAIIFVFRYTKSIISKYNVDAFKYVLSWGFIILSFVIYYFSTMIFLSNEVLELNNKKITIKKFIFSYCYYNKEILLEKVSKISYKNPTYLIISCLFFPLFFKGNNNIIIQANIGLEEDEEFYFGVGVNLEIYGKFVKTLKEILNDRIKDIDFIYIHKSKF